MARSFDVDHGEGLLIADASEEFARQVDALLNDASTPGKRALYLCAKALLAGCCLSKPSTQLHESCRKKQSNRLNKGFTLNPQTVILAGGLGTRLRPLTNDRPKSMVEVLGKPFLQHQIELLRGQGLTRFVLCVGHRADQIVSHFGDGTSLGVRVQYSHDGASPLGTGGALIKAVPLLDSWFLVLDGDSYLPIDFHAPITRFRKQPSPALMTVYQNENRYGRSNVAIEDGWVTVYNRRQGDFVFIHAGLTILERNALEMLAADRFMPMDEIYQGLVARGKLACFILQQRFYEIGSHAGLTELKDYLTTQRPQVVELSRPTL